MKNSEGLWCPLLALSRFRIVPGVEVVRVGWTIAGNLDDYRVGVRPGEMIVAARFRVHASRRECLQHLLIEMVAVGEVPLARNNGGRTIISVLMRLDCGVNGHEQQNRVEAYL